MSFTFNGISSDSFGIIVRDIKRPLLPDQNDNYLQILGRHGSYLFNHELNDRIIEIDCVLADDTIENLRDKLRQIAVWLYVDERKPLSFADELDKYYLAKLDGVIDVEQIIAIGQFTLRFRCEPFAYGAEQQARFENDTATVTNSGTFEALPVFTATFTSVASEWKVTLGTKYIRVVRDFQAGDVLEANCVTGVVKVNGASVMVDLDWQNSEFFALQPGESDLTITPVGVCDTTVKFKPRWL